MPTDVFLCDLEFYRFVPGEGISVKPYSEGWATQVKDLQAKIIGLESKAVDLKLKMRSICWHTAVLADT